jgi:hypothetical protein
VSVRKLALIAVAILIVAVVVIQIASGTLTD